LKAGHASERTKTLAAVMVPAAVINIGKIFGSERAASSTASYPEIVAMEERASILWARVIRGISSMARKVTPAAARSEPSLAAVSGSPNPMTVCPRRRSERSARPASGLAPSVSLDDHVRGLKHFGPASQAGAASRVLVIGESGLYTSRPLDDDAGAQFRQCITVARRDGHAPLAREGFARYSNGHTHDASPFSLADQPTFPIASVTRFTTDL